MRDPWKYLAFPAAAVAGYLLSFTIVSFKISSYIGLPEQISRIIVVALAGLLAGFLVDDVIPAYVEKVRNRRGGEFGGGDMEGDFDLE